MIVEEWLGISIHALREEGDVMLGAITLYLMVFQSTPSARRATAQNLVPSLAVLFQSTPSARRATPRRQREDYANHISIHALREEGDPCHN